MQMIYRLIHKNRIAWKVIVSCFLVCVCSSSGQYRIPDPLPDDRNNIPEPAYREINIAADAFKQTVDRQIGILFDFSRHVRALAHNPKQAKNVNAFDEVANSSWFINRNAYKRLSISETECGPNTGSGPDCTDTWTIIRAKAEGVTPGFHIQDSRGDRYLIKFDPVGYSEMVTGAEIVSTKLFYAAGYNVPENYLVYFQPEILALGEQVKFTDGQGQTRFMAEKDLKEILDRIEIQPDGSIRALASKYIPGNPIGPFSYEGIRQDDPNDIIPHQHRRELRGLYVMAAWVSHFDTKANNSFDTYVTEEERSYVKHYLIDFGSTLGTGAYGPSPPFMGHTYEVDLLAMTADILTFGLYVKPYKKVAPAQFSSIGRYESALFHPAKYKPQIPNPAFNNCTNRDGYWGAKLVMSFTDKQLRTIVESAQYSEPRAAEYLLKTLKERRDKTGRYWFKQINPLDDFQLKRYPDGAVHIIFKDKAVENGFEPARDSQYKYTIRYNEESIAENVLGETSIPLPSLPESIVENSDRMLYAEITIHTRRQQDTDWSKWTKVYALYNPGSDRYVLVGIQRQE